VGYHSPALEIVGNLRVLKSIQVGLDLVNIIYPLLLYLTNRRETKRRRDGGEKADTAKDSVRDLVKS
jgi:hypothetical protein